MNPDAWQMAVMSEWHRIERREENARRAALHRKAKARRDRAKRGGKR